MEPKRADLPSFREYRRRNDPLMVPDKGFTKQLKKLDADLDVVWDWGSDKWEIWCFPTDGRDEYLVMKVQAKGKTYRELGQDLLLNIQMHMQIGAENILDYLDEHNEQIERRKRRDFKNKIESMALDSFGPLFSYSTQVPKEYILEKPRTQKILEVI